MIFISPSFCTILIALESYDMWREIFWHQLQKKKNLPSFKSIKYIWNVSHKFRHHSLMFLNLALTLLIKSWIKLAMHWRIDFLICVQENGTWFWGTEFCSAGCFLFLFVFLKQHYILQHCMNPFITAQSL